MQRLAIGGAHCLDDEVRTGFVEADAAEDRVAVPHRCVGDVPSQTPDGLVGLPENPLEFDDAGADGFVVRAKARQSFLLQFFAILDRHATRALCRSTGARRSKVREPLLEFTVAGPG